MRNFRSLLTILILLAGWSAFGQTNTARLTGIVTDSDGAVVHGATVNALNDATGVMYKAISDDSGLYSISNLPVGQYTLKVDHPGFKAYIRSGIDLHTAQVLELNVNIPVGSVMESVTVSSGVPLLETQTSDFSQNLERKSIATLPLGNRRAMNIIQLMPAAVFVTDSPNGQPVYSLAGGRGQTQMVWIDGSNGQNIRIGAGQENVEPPIEITQDIQVLANNYSAEYGASDGGVVVETTKSGTNQFHGAAYEFLRNDDLNAPGYFAKIATNGSKIIPELRYNLFGGTLGGPIRHNKTFFFVGYEGLRQLTGSVTTLTVPTQLQRNGDFSQTFNAQGALIPIYDPSTTKTVGGVVTRTQFPGNVIPAGEQDSVALKILNYYPLPNQAPSNIAGANNFSLTGVTGFNSDFVLVKIDEDLSARDKLIGRYVFYRSPGFVTHSVYPDPGADPSGVSANHTNLWFGAWTRIISPSKINDLRFTYTNRLALTTTSGQGRDYPQKIGLTGVVGNNFPSIAPAGFSSLGSTSQYRLQSPVAQYQILDNFTQTIGRHTFVFGGEVRKTMDYDSNQQEEAGAFTFATQATGLPNNSATGNGLASLMVGFPTAFAELDVDKIQRTSWYYGAFAQDNWTIRPDLTLNLGIRWETDSPMVDANNRLNGFDSTAINPVSGTPGVVEFAGVNGYPTTPYNWDLNNFGPRLGFSWRPFQSSSWVIRGGSGLFFGLPYDGPVPIVALGFQTSVTLNSPDNGITAPFYLRNGVPAMPTAPTLSSSYGAVPVGQNPNTTVTYFDRNRPTGYAENFNFDIQRALPASSLIDLTLLGNLGRKLPGTTISINQIAPNVLSATKDTQAYRPFPQFSDVQSVDPNIGDSNYYAGIIRYEKRFSKGWNAVATYTWSKWLGNNFVMWTSSAPYSNYYNRKADYGPTAYDIEQHVSFGPSFELPFGPGKPWLSNGILGQVIGGWVVGNITTLESGEPNTVTAQTNTTNSFSAGSLRPNMSGNPNLPKNSRNVKAWFNESVFSQPAALQFGNEGAGVVRSPGYMDVDFSLIRQFRLNEGMQMEVRAESFNTFNHPNFGAPGTVFGSAAFGTITSEVQPRQLQVGARFTF